MKKDKGFIAIIAILALACVSGVGFCVKEVLGNSKTQASIEKTQKAVKRLANRGGELALTEENVGIEESNQKKIKEAEARKVLELKGKKAAGLLPNVTGDATAFVSSLRGHVESWEKDLKENQKIALDDDVKYFGFSRYLQNTQSGNNLAPDALPLLSSEQNVAKLLVDKLVSARNASEEVLRSNGLLPAGKRQFLLLKNIRREAGELMKKEGGASVPMYADELTVLDSGNSAETGLYRVATNKSARGRTFASLRRPDAIDAVAFQIGFVAPTSVLRNFVASFSDNGDYPIYVRDVVVTPADSEEVSTAKLVLDPPPAPVVDPNAAPSADVGADFDIFGVGPAADDAAAPVPSVPAAPVKSVILPETLSEIWVTVEYVSPVEKKSAPSEEEGN